jgi:hypothetical protein
VVWRGLAKGISEVRVEIEFEETKCASCEVILDAPRGDRSPCPVCSETSRIVLGSLSDRMRLLDGYDVRHRKPGKKGWRYREENQPEFYRLRGEWQRVRRVYDRDNDRYFEEITRLSDGTVSLHVEEPLSEHRGHGSNRESD